MLVVAAIVILRLPQQRFAPSEIRIEHGRQQVTPLVAPPVSVLTQRSPNRSEISKEFNLSSLPPRPAQPNVPSTPGAAAPPRQKFVLPERRAPGVPSPAIQDAPALDVRSALPPAPVLGAQIPGPPPQIDAQEKPKLAFERPGLPTGTPSGQSRINIPRPANTVAEAARQAIRSSGGGLVVGDEEAIPGAMPSAPSVPIPGKLGSAVELMSDPMGVDFWPYMVKVLSTVRRNWFAVTPESARLGRQGRVIIQFAINRDGSVPKLVSAAPSGTDALDRAAVAGISASNPFPPLPPEFKGGQIRLQFVFKYNVR
jgi:TonB family protein